MLLVVGLGNPGADSAANRHNIGFMAVDAVARHHSFDRFRARFQGKAAEGRVDGCRLLVLKPLTFMNESGRSVAAAASFYKVPTANVLVFHDELDLAAGHLRVKTGGGNAGHKGLRNIQAHIGPDFRRVRLGIGHPGNKDRVTAHVLKDFAKADKPWIEELMAALAEHFPRLVAGDDAAFMSKVALAVKPVLPRRRAADGPADKQPDGQDGL